jgi:hypothetical protein
MTEKNDIFEKCSGFTTAKELQHADLYPFFRVIESAQDPEVIMNGKKRSGNTAPDAPDRAF